MLSFVLDEEKKVCKKSLLKMPLSEVINDRRRFVVLVDEKEYFEDEYFPIKEFVICSISWMIKSEKDFIYNTIDDYQNPLLAFRKLKKGWKLQSVWQKFECEILFSFDEVFVFISNIIAQVIY